MSMTEETIRHVQALKESARGALWDELLNHKKLCDVVDEAERAKHKSWERCDAMHKMLEAYETQLEELMEERRREQQS